ncbi:MAG: hypothetical protein RR524_00140 [Erysipelotrichaceae bacterium]
MGKNKKKREPSISGRNIYKDKHGRFILYNKKKAIGYVVPEDKFGQYQLYSNRFIFGLVMAALLGSFELFPMPMLLYVCIGAGILLYLLLELRYRTYFIPSLTQIEKFEPENSRSRFAIMAEQKTGMLVLLGVLYVAVGILFVLLGHEQKFDNFLLGACYIICAFALYFAGLHFYVVLYKQKHPEEVSVTTEKSPAKKIKLKK